MITIRDWIATIPEEEKHIAFVGEHQSVIREFLLTGADWENYQDWGFHLDMAFDLSTVTSREQHKRETTQVNQTETVTDIQVKTTGTTTKESFLVEDVEVDCAARTDIATLIKEVQEDGILLKWQVLRQHTQLPGKLTATLRAIGDGGKVKKSDLMVFEVEPAVVAEPAAELPQSEFEALEERLTEIMTTVMINASDAKMYAQDAKDNAIAVNDWKTEAASAADQTAKDALLTQQAKAVALKVQDELKGAFRRYPSNNLLNLDTVIYGKGMDKAGHMGVTDEYDISLTDYIPVTAGDVLSFQCTNPETGEREHGDLYLVCLFDANKQVNLEANHFPPDENGELHEITVPEGVAYVRMTLHDLPQLLDPAIVNSHDLLPYEPYVGTYRLKPDAYNAEEMQAFLQAVRCVSQTLSEQEKAQARQNIGAMSSDYTVPVDDAPNIQSANPISSRGVMNMYQSAIKPYLLPANDNSQSQYIVRVKNGGGSYECIPVQQEPFIKNKIMPYLLPMVTAADNGKTLKVVNGTWKLV